MNERIKQLAEQAVKHSMFEYMKPSIVVGEGENKMEIPLVFAEKFAELIVKECCDKLESTDIVHGYVAKFLSNEIKEHFGVE